MIRTTGHCVAETGLQYSILSLHPYQLHILHNGQERVFLTGPPGTGKTVVLALKAKEWLCHEKVVHFVSTHYKGRAVSILLQQQVCRSRHAPIDVSRTRRLEYNFDTNKGDVDAAVDELSASAVDGEVFVIVDEVVVTHRSELYVCHRGRGRGQPQVRVVCLSSWTRSWSPTGQSCMFVIVDEVRSDHVVSHCGRGQVRSCWLSLWTSSDQIILFVFVDGVRPELCVCH